MDLKKRVSAVHQKIKDLGYDEFKRTHVQEVLATALGFRNYHTMKAHHEGNPLQSALDVLLKREKNFLVPVGASTIDQYYSEYEFVSLKLSEQDINKIISLINSPILDDESIKSLNLNLPSMVITKVEGVDRDEDDDDEIITSFETSDFDHDETDFSIRVNKKEVFITVEIINKKEVISLYGHLSINELEAIPWEIVNEK